MKTKLLTLLPVGLLLVSCAGAGSTATPTVTETVTQTVTAPPPEITAPPEPVPAGTTVNVSNTGTTATFYKYKQIQDEYNEDIGAFEVEVCLGAEPENAMGQPGVTAQRWSLRDSNHGIHAQSSGFTGNPVTPMYPHSAVMNWGECARGWIIMPITEGTNITEARYVTASNEIFTWKVK